MKHLNNRFFRIYIIENYREFYTNDVCKTHPDVCEWVKGRIQENNDWIEGKVKKQTKIFESQSQFISSHKII